LRGHRMVVIGFEDSSNGQRRVVVKDLVGGRALKDEQGEAGDEEWSWRDGAERQVRRVTKQVVASTGIGDADGDTLLPMLKSYPPNGGVGMRVRALWSYWPAEGVKDELGFPRGAEIGEVKDINGDWFWGIYAGRDGVFPGNYVKVVRVVTM